MKLLRQEKAVIYGQTKSKSIYDNEAYWLFRVEYDGRVYEQKYLMLSNALNEYKKIDVEKVEDLFAPSHYKQLRQDLEEARSKDKDFLLVIKSHRVLLFEYYSDKKRYYRSRNGFDSIREIKSYYDGVNWDSDEYKIIYHEDII